MEPKILAITIKPKPTTYWNTDLIMEFYNQLTILRKFIRCNDMFKIWPELFTSGHWHYHIIITLQNEVQYTYFYKTLCPLIRRHLGFVTIKEVKNMEGWLTYCAKNQILIESILSEECIPIPITHEWLYVYNKNYLKNKINNAIENNI